MNTHFSFANLGAQTVDSLIQDRESKIGQFTCKEVLARLVSSVAFPIFAALDFVMHATTLFFVSLAAPFSSKAASIAKEQFKLMGKSLLGIVSSPLGLLSPDLVTYHFLNAEKPSTQVKDSGKLYSGNAEEHAKPSTIDEVKALVNRAREQGLKIGVAGAQLAQGGHTIPSNDKSIFISTKNLNAIEVNKEQKTVRVGAGAIWEDIQEEAHKAGLAVKVMQASNIFSVGGSLSTNVHGWDHQKGSIINTVNSVTIIDADGNERKLHKNSENLEEKELFNSVIGGYGLFGIIVEAELELTEDAILTREAEIVTPAEYSNHFKNTILGKDDIAMHYGRLSLEPKNLFEEIISVKYTKTPDAAYQRPQELSREERGGAAKERILAHTLRRLNLAKNLKQSQEKKTFLPTIQTSRNETMRPNIRFIEHPSKFDADMLQEYFVSADKLEGFLKDLKKIAQDNEVNLMNATIRYVTKDEQSTLAYAKEDSFAIVLYFNQSLAEHQLKKMENWTQEIVEKSLEHGGSFYLPYHRFPTVEQFQQAYPNAERFKAIKKQVDPTEMFSSQFYAHYFN